MTTNKRSRIIGLLMALMMVFAMLPTAVFAETAYNLYVNGEQITDERLEIVCGSGSATYDPAASNLTLNNATITQSEATNKYGIRMPEKKKLTVTLEGTNSIVLPDGGGIMTNGDIEITGEGKLVIEVSGVTYDGISTLGNILITGKANVEIKAEKGIGIVGKTVEINGAKVTSVALYAGIDACGLKIVNESDVVIEATEDQRNAAFVRLDENDNGGNIELSMSKVRATSFYPGIYASGDIIINGGEIHSVSTANSAIWTLNNMTVKGGAKLVLDGKYPAGGNGNFIVEAADIDAKNTNEDNIPAIFDIPTISEGYKLTFAKAIDSENVEIDLLSSGTQYLNLYKNVHFITEDIISKVELPFKKIVKQDGNMAPGKQTFEFEIFDIGNYNEEEYEDVTVTAQIETNGAGDYNGNIIIEGPYSQVNEFICEGFYIREKNTGAADWTYSDAVYHAMTYREDDTHLAFDIFPVKLVVTDNGEYYQPTQDIPVDIMTFENTYTYNVDMTPSTVKLPFTKTVKQDGNTAPGKQIFEFEIFDIGNRNTEEYADVTVTAQIETNGAGDYNGEIIIAGPKYQVDAFICEGFYIREKNTGAANWTYSDAVYHVMTYREDDTHLAFDIFPVKLMVTDNEVYYEPTQDMPVEVMVFENTYSFNSENPPETGDTENLMLWFALLFVSIAAVTVTIVCGKKIKEF